MLETIQIPTAPAIVKSPREQWLARRREGVGASEVAAILGFDPTRDALSVYAEKIGVLESEENFLSKWGKRVEDAIAEGYAEETGRVVLNPGEFEIAKHPDLPILGATLDRETYGTDRTPAPAAGKGSLEIKAVNAFAAAEWKEEPPLKHQIQLQIQIACKGMTWGSLCALIGGLKISWQDIARNQPFLDHALREVEIFWRCVQRREPPIVKEAKDATWDAIKALYPSDNGLGIVLPVEAIDIVKEWREYAAVRLEAGKREDNAKVQLQQLMGEATAGLLVDGSSLTFKASSREGYTVAPTTYRTLRHLKPKGSK
jgi:putative phage-type endonuclease